MYTWKNVSKYFSGFVFVFCSSPYISCSFSHLNLSSLWRAVKRPAAKGFRKAAISKRPAVKGSCLLQKSSIFFLQKWKNRHFWGVWRARYRTAAWVWGKDPWWCIIQRFSRFIPIYWAKNQGLSLSFDCAGSIRVIQSRFFIPDNKFFEKMPKSKYRLYRHLQISFVRLSKSG